MAERILTTVALSSGLCLFMNVLGGGSLSAQTSAPTNGAPVAASEGCTGALCSLTPGSMARPILAEEAKRAEAERDSHPTPDVATAPKGDHQHRGARRGHHATFARARGAHPVDGRSVAARAAPIKPRPIDITPTGPINTIFVLAPRPFDPYGGDYAPWLDRLAWPSRFDRAGDRTVFSADGYREADTAPTLLPPATDAADDLARRSRALSQQGFKELQADLGGS